MVHSAKTMVTLKQIEFDVKNKLLDSGNVLQCLLLCSIG